VTHDSTSIDTVILVAMPEEAEPFLQRADSAHESTRVGNADHWELTVAGRQVLLVRSGVGLVNSSAAAAIALTAVEPSVVISAGSAGGLGADVRVGEVVIGATYTYSAADARAFGYELGQVPGMPPFYSADEGLLAALSAIEADGLTMRTGRVLSSDTFVSAEATAPMRLAFPTALSADMESTAIAQTCASFSTPFCSIRGISDLCGPAGDEDFVAHVDDAADRSAQIVLRLIEQL
jgi:adenosylhomocysteine nucleosidase